MRIGSSPLARGTPEDEHRQRSGVLAHPRSRGEHAAILRDLEREVGSSPLARGTPWVGFFFRASPRLIPARAGNTKSVSWIEQETLAHPRSRGEHPLFKTAHATACGSSPLARGTRVDQVCLVLCARLIPARAGNTTGVLRFLHSRTAHPRSRGEHLICLS